MITKLAELAFAGITTLNGAEATEPLLLESFTVIPPAKAGALSCTVPVTGDPPFRLVGLTDKPESIKGFIGKLAATEVSAAEFATMIEAAPTAAISAARTFARNCVLETNVVVLSVPFHRTLDPERKFVPFTNRAKAGLPAIADAGLKPTIFGNGFPMTKLFGLEIPPAGVGFDTLIAALPTAARSPAEIWAFI